MSKDATRGLLASIAVRNMLVDRYTAEVHERLADAGIDAMLVKGPVIDEALYAETARPYVDSDLLVRSTNWNRAIDVLTGAGFSEHLAPLDHPGMGSLGGMAFLRDGDNIDLHGTIPGLEAPAELVWETLRGAARSMVVGGRSIPVPDRAAMIMHIALHASHHPGREKPLEDLRRAIDRCELHEWRAAALLAEQLDGLPAFVAGLRSLEGGASLAAELGVANHSSARVELQRSEEPLAEGLHNLLAADVSWTQRLSIVLRELFPSPSFMKWHSERARTSVVGLISSYPRRWVWLFRHLPGGVAEVMRVSRRRQR